MMKKSQSYRLTSMHAYALQLHGTVEKAMSYSQMLNDPRVVYQQAVAGNIRNNLTAVKDYSQMIISVMIFYLNH